MFFNKYVTNSHNYLRAMKRFANKNNIGINDNGILDIRTYSCGEVEKKRGNCYYNIIELPQNNSEIRIVHFCKKDTNKHQDYMCQNTPMIEKISIGRLKMFIA